MVEVFSTNVENQDQASFIIEKLGQKFPAYQINFDLEDCDGVLRVESSLMVIEVLQIIKLLSEFGFIAQMLEDDTEYNELIDTSRKQSYFR